MIEITRVCAQQLRSVWQQAVLLGGGRGPWPPLVLHAGKEGLRLQIHHPDVAVALHVPGARPTDILTLPAAALEDFAGRKADCVTLENVRPGGVQARWDENGLPQVADYHAPDGQKWAAFPEEPGKLYPQNPGILRALEEAGQSAARDGGRPSLQKILLRGGTGDIVATDGVQLLVQGGFDLPWQDDLLVPATGVFACPELFQTEPVALAKTDTHVCIRFGRWALFLRIDPADCFPEVRRVLPAAREGATRCRLAPEDAAFLRMTLPHLPGRDEDDPSLTLDLNGFLAVRAQAEGSSRPTEIVLARSPVVGPPARCVSSRRLLARAVALGFRTLQLARADRPLVWVDEGRTYLWMPREKGEVLAPAADGIRIPSTSDGPALRRLLCGEVSRPS